MLVSPPVAVAALGTCFAVCAAAYQTPPAKETVPPPTYVVFFEGTSGELTPQGQIVLEQVASAAADHGPDLVRVSGYSDRIKDPDSRFDLAERRAATVIEVLSARGIPVERVPLHLTSDMPVADLPLAPEHEHRVEIAFADD